MAEYVVAGVTGHTGSVVAQTLLDSGRKVRVLTRDPHKAERWKKRGAHVGQTDLSSSHDLLNGLRGTEAAYFILPSFPPNTTSIRGKAKKMIDAMVQAIGGTDVKHVVFVSSVGAQHADGTGPVVLHGCCVSRGPGRCPARRCPSCRRESSGGAPRRRRCARPRPRWSRRPCRPAAW